MNLDICNASNPLDRIMEIVKGLLGDKDKVTIQNSKAKLGKLDDSLRTARVRLHISMNAKIRVMFDKEDIILEKFTF